MVQNAAEYNKQYYLKNKERTMEKLKKKVQCDVCGRTVSFQFLPKHKQKPICLYHASLRPTFSDSIAKEVLGQLSLYFNLEALKKEKEQKAKVKETKPEDKPNPPSDEKKKRGRPYKVIVGRDEPPLEEKKETPLEEKKELSEEKKEKSKGLKKTEEEKPLEEKSPVNLVKKKKRMNPPDNVTFN